MTYTHDDRADLAEIGGSVTAVMADIAHHEMGDITEGWSVYEDMPTEITRLRERLEQLAEAATNGLADLRRLEIRAKVREVWAQAFAAGRVPDHEEQVGDHDQLNISGVVDALMNAEQQVGIDPGQIEHHGETVMLEDQVFERILDTEGPHGESEQANRAAAVVRAFITAVYGEAKV